MTGSARTPDTREAHAPVVTIFVPVYEREHYLPETLDSLLGQTYRSFELVVADDGSTDGSLEVARAYAERDGRVRVLELPHRGEVATRNDAVAAAHPATRYLMNHDSDDVSLPTKLERLVGFLERTPGVAIVGCHARYFDDAGNDLGEPHLEDDPDRIRATFDERNSIVNSAALIRREVFDRIGGYRPAFAGIDDYDFFARALVAGFELANVPDHLHRIRLHRTSIVATRARRSALLAARLQADYRLALGGAQPGRRGRARLLVSAAMRKTRAQLRYWAGSAVSTLRGGT